ncbi:MAG: selenoneine synthase SenA [Acidimicrobiales bacterium]
MDAIQTVDRLAVDATALAGWVAERRHRLLGLVADLDDEQLVGPMWPTINPLDWEIGHVGWFQEHFVLRDLLGEAPIIAHADALWDSGAVPHDTRWFLRLPARADILTYLTDTAERVIARLDDSVDQDPQTTGPLLYRVRYVTHHEDWHSEAIVYTRQALGLPEPSLATPASSSRAVPGSTAAAEGNGALPGDVRIPGGRFLLGAEPGAPFVFDNEKWAHVVELEPFDLARAPVTQSELADFVDDGGYRRSNLWSDEGWAWREAAAAEHPLYWRRGAGGWERRRFDRWSPLERDRPAVHLSFFEAEAWCRWAHRRLPTEAEWEAAAIGVAGPDGQLAPERRLWPWGEEPPDAQRANLDGWRFDTVDVAACPSGDSAFGVRQLVGNVWEWTSTVFEPFPGFERDVYVQNSEPWFGTRRVLRGGGWATRSELVRPTLRNYFTPDRRDVFAGLRTVRLG